MMALRRPVGSAMNAMPIPASRNDRRFIKPWLLAGAGSLLLCLLGCAGPETNASPGDAAGATGTAMSSEHRVTYLMGHLSTFSNKAGWATQAENQKLATFYLDKMDEAMEELARVDRWQGIPIGSMAKATMSGSLKALRGSVESGDWTAAKQTYSGMTAACNSCHSATQREYIVISPVTDTPPQGQQFHSP